MTGANRWRTAGLTAIFILGVATVVWPLTIGAAGLSQLIAANHQTMFLLGGAMMLIIGVATLRGWMWHHAPSVGGGDPSGLVGIYLMGVFAGAATACCAPVLAGAVAIAGVSSSWWAGAVLGLFYLFGLVSPLLLSALGIGHLRDRLRDPSLTLRLAGRRVQTTAARLTGGGMFLVLGILMIFLAVSGNASTAPGFQKAFGRWLNTRANELVTSVPSVGGWAIVLALLGLVTYLGVRALRRPVSPGASGSATPPAAPCCQEKKSDLEGVAH